MKPGRNILMSAVLTMLAAVSVASAEKTADFVRGGRAVSEIIVSQRAGEPELYAAQELQTWIGNITGAFVPVLKKCSGESNVKIFIGREFAAKDYRKDLGAIGGTDGFAVRTAREADGTTKIFVFGVVPRGTLHGVCELLERNTDIIWARPDPVIGTVYGRTENLPVKDADFIDIPKSRFRGWQWIYHSPSGETEWSSRNRMNRLRMDQPKFAGMFTSGGYGHGIQRYIDPKVYFGSHPEYYPEINGKRTPAGQQICLLAYEMIPEFLKNMREEIKSDYRKVRKPAQVRIDFFNLSTADNWRVCNCAKCTAPFRTEDGKTVAPEDPAFRSSQYYTFINKIAREIGKSHPNVVIGVYAYIFTSQPPPFKLEKNIRVNYCPFVMNEKVPIYDDQTNGLWHKYLDRWAEMCRMVYVREYLGWANKFPRSQEYRIQKNGLYYLKHKVLEYSAEHPVDIVSKAYPLSDATWDVSGMSAWVISRLWWNPEQDIEKLRNHYMARTYREAAPYMKVYHDLLRDSFYSSKLPSIYSDELLPMVSTYIIKPGLTERCRAALEKALAAAVHPVSMELISRQLKHFNNWIANAKADKTVRMSVPCSSAKDILDSFDSDIWNNAAQTDDFVVADQGERHGKKAKFRTAAKLLHDRENLYIYFDCHAPDMAALKGNVAPGGGVEAIPRGDVMEFFLGHAATGVYYQFMFDCGNENGAGDVLFDAKGYDSSWNGTWKRRVKRYPDKWSAIVKVPLDEIGLNITENNRLLFQAVRGKSYDSGTRTPKGEPRMLREMASWNGGWVHQMDSFGELTLNQN